MLILDFLLCNKSTAKMTDAATATLPIGTDDAAALAAANAAMDPVIAPAAPPAAGAAKDPTNGTNPLDALEAILEQAKAKSSTGQKGGADADKPTDTAEAEAEAQRQADLLAMEEASKAADAIALQEKMVDLQQVTQSPQYQARVEQNAALEQTQAIHQQKHDEFEIRQLSHTKM